MTSRLKAVFPDDWQDILQTYMGLLSATGSRFDGEELPLALVEVGVIFGSRLSELALGGFVEIGCGLGIPSLTLAKLGRTGGRAVDVDAKVLARAEGLRQRLGCDLDFQCRDVFADRPELENGQMLIAEKPASYKKNTLEVEYKIANWCKIERHNLAMIPSFLETDTFAAYTERCGEYDRKLRQVGFKVDNRQVYERLPYRWIIALK